MNKILYIEKRGRNFWEDDPINLIICLMLEIIV